MSDRRSFLGAIAALGTVPLLGAGEKVEPPKPEPCGAVAMRSATCMLPLGHEGKHHAVVMGRSSKGVILTPWTMENSLPSPAPMQVMREIYW